MAASDLLDNEKYETYGPYHLTLYKNGPRFRRETDYVINWFTSLQQDKTRKILDIGCGEGLYVHLLTNLGYRISGIDANRLAVAIGFDNDNLVKYGSVYDFKEKADVAILFHAFEHFAEPKKAVEHISLKITQSIFIVNPLWESKHHHDKYTLKDIIKYFGYNWTVQSYHVSNNCEYIRLIRKDSIKSKLVNKQLLKYEYKFYDREAIIFCPGPSIRKYQPIKNEDRYIKIGVKQAIDFRDDYDFYFFGDKNDRSIDYEDKIRFAKCRKLCLCQINGMDCATLYSTYEAKKKFNATPVNLQGFGNGTSYNIDVARVAYRQGTTAHAAINFALFCGIRKIYLVGCDGSISKNLNIDDNTPSEHHRRIWESFDEYFNFPDIEYIFVNPVNIFTKRYKILWQ